MEQIPKIENGLSQNESAQEAEIKSIEKEKLEEIMKEYEQDPNSFYAKNAFELWDGGKNPALLVSLELANNYIQEIWEEKNLGKPGKIMTEARNVAMFVMKYLGADIEGWCKVDPETAIAATQQMGASDFQENCDFILEKIKANDPVFSEFLTKISVKDISGNPRDENEIVAIVTTVNLIARTMYEQMQKDARKKAN